MKNAFDLLSEEEVRRIVTLLAQLKESHFDFLQLQVGDVKLTVSKNGQVAMAEASAAVAAPAIAERLPPATANDARTPAVAAAPTGGTPPARSGPATGGASRADALEIIAPMMGRYFAQSEPGAPPYVEVGQEVNAETTVCLIEVMKVFNAVPAGIGGIVAEICVQDGQLVEYGQTLLRLQALPVSVAATAKAG